MSNLNTQTPFVPGRLQQMSTRVAFFIAGFGIAAWAPLVPYAKARAGLYEGTLGLLLLCLGVGSILAMPMAGMLSTRFGCRRVAVGGTLLICAALPLLATVSAVPALMAALFMFGAGLGTVDSTVNLQAVIVERASGKTMMSGFHGLFSLGGIVGAAGVSALLGLGISPLGATLVVVLVLIAALFKAAPHMLPYGSESSGPAFAVPHGIVLFIGGMCFIVFLAEGAALDWSAVFLVQERGIATAYAGLGYAAFALTMTVGRLTGDTLVHRLGATRVIVCGGLLAAGGLFLATFAGLGSGIGRLCDARRRLLEHRAGVVHRRGQTDCHAGKHRGPGHHHPRLCRHPGRARSDRLYRPRQQFEFCLWPDGAAAGGRGDWRESVEGVNARSAPVGPGLSRSRPDSHCLHGHHRKRLAPTGKGQTPASDQNPTLACTKNVRGVPTYRPALLSLERVKYCLSKRFFTPAPSFRLDNCGPKS